MSQILESSDLLINFESLRLAIKTKEELKILDELQILINNLSIPVLEQNVEKMETSKMLKVVNSQTKINNILSELYSIICNLKNIKEDENEKIQNEINNILDELQREFEEFEYLIKNN